MFGFGHCVCYLSVPGKDIDMIESLVKSQLRVTEMLSAINGRSMKNEQSLDMIIKALSVNDVEFAKSIAKNRGDFMGTVSYRRSIQQINDQGATYGPNMRCLETDLRNDLFEIDISQTTVTDKPEYGQVHIMYVSIYFVNLFDCNQIFLFNCLKFCMALNIFCGI